MTDPSDALASFQSALSDGGIQLQRCELDKDLFVHLDSPTGVPRFTYVRIEQKAVTALVILISVDPLNGAPCFQIGYAVPSPYRNQGRAKNAVIAAVAELWNGFSRNGMRTLYIEGIVGADNEASNHVASATLSASPTEITDSVSGLPALHYIKKLGD